MKNQIEVGGSGSDVVKVWNGIRFRATLPPGTKLYTGEHVDALRGQLQIANADYVLLWDTHRKLIQAEMIARALAERVARLNPAAGEIGPGMLASLVEDARRITGEL